MPFDKTLYPNTNLLIHAIFGGCLGFFTSIIFLIIYYGTKYDIPVADSIRFSAAFWNTTLIVIAILVVLFHRNITAALSKAFEKEEFDEAE
jgi:hypothetical protein